MGRKSADKLSAWLNEEGGFSDDSLAKVSAWARNGLTDKDIATNMHISRSTLGVWKQRFPALAAALRSSKAEADAVVENALYKNATGYFYTEETVVMVRHVEYGENGKRVSEDVTPQVVELRRFFTADTKAAFLWLKNRRPKHWRDKREYELETPQERIVVMDDAEKYSQ